MLFRVAEVQLVGGGVGRQSAHRGKGVHEIESFVLHALEQHGTFRRFDGVPTHVRHHVGVEQLDIALDQTETGRAVAMFHATFEHDLLAHADAEHRAAGAQTVFDDPVSADAFQSFHACAERAHTRHHQSVGFQSLTMVGREGHVEVEIGQRAHHGTHVAETVIEHHHGSHGRSPSFACRRIHPSGKNLFDA